MPLRHALRKPTEVHAGQPFAGSSVPCTVQAQRQAYGKARMWWTPDMGVLTDSRD
jgi:hypothetical protein